MKLLVIGSGGREHAIAWKLSRSPRVGAMVCCPGNAGMAHLGDCWSDLDPAEADALIARVRAEKIDWVVIGPEAPLAAGLADRLRAEGIAVSGPGREASRLEGSKTHAKEFMQRHGIPTAAFRVVADPGQLAAAFDALEGRLVVKADGLAAGKGVLVSQDRAEAESAARAMLSGESFGDAGRTVVLEECLDGVEMTMLVFVSGTTAIPLQSAQDYKPLLDGNQGPNTGGMGAYSPTRLLTPQIRQRVIADVLEPTLQGLASEGIDYRGVLYLGLMLTSAGPQLLEYNVRFGDPETQPLLMRLRTDLVDVYEAIESGNLADLQLEWDDRAALCLVLASQGYPGAYPQGIPIRGELICDRDADVQVFHAGTRRQGGDFVTAGGRVLGVTAMGIDLAEARERAYAAAAAIEFEGKVQRSDIGLHATLS